MVYELQPQLLGRGLRPAERQAPERGPRHLWDHHPGTPEQASLIVYKPGSDSSLQFGTVREGFDFQSWEIAGDDILVFIMGGSDYRCEPGEIHDILMAAGYTCGFGVDIDIYLPDYTDEYPIEGTTP